MRHWFYRMRRGSELLPSRLATVTVCPCFAFARATNAPSLFESSSYQIRLRHGCAGSPVKKRGQLSKNRAKQPTSLASPGNSRDWQQLIEVCRMVDTLLMDQEVIYDSRNSNDRLLLGLKGSLNEYELDLLRQRSQEARRQKASRGELVVAAPIGYHKTADQRLEKDPDRRVQEAIHLIFRKFFELGTVRQTLLWLVEQGIDLPVAEHHATRRKTVWKHPCYGSVLNILRDPVYAGAYRYGRTAVTTSIGEGRLRKRTVRKPLKSWSVLIPSHHEVCSAKTRAATFSARCNIVTF